MAIKKLSATPMSAAEVTKTIPVTRLERFSFCRYLYSNPPGGNASARKSLAQAMEREGYRWEMEAEAGLVATDHEKTLEIVLSSGEIRDAIKFIDEVAGSAPGRLAFALLDMKDRLEYVRGTKED